MAFEVLEKGGGLIPRGRCSLTARGMARLNARDLEEVGIGDRATILIDRESGSIALRAPLESEDGMAVGREGRKSKSVWLAGAMRALELDAASFHGWQDVAAREDRLEFRLTANVAGGGAKERRKR